MGVGRCVDWGVGLYGCVGSVPYMHACTHAHTHACTHMHVVNMINMDASMGVSICNFYTCIHMHVCMCACVCVHVHVCGDTLHAPRHSHPPAPPPELKKPKLEELQ